MLQYFSWNQIFLRTNVFSLNGVKESVVISNDRNNFFEDPLRAHLIDTATFAQGIWWF